MDITTHDLGFSTMETMSRPLDQWHHEPSSASRPGSYPDTQSRRDDARIPRLSTPPNFPFRLPPPQITHRRLSGRDSIQNSYTSTPSPLDRPSPLPFPFSETQYVPEVSPGSYYDYQSPPAQPSPAISSHVVRPQQPWNELTPMPAHYVPAKTFQPANIISSCYPNSTSSQPSQFSQPASPVGSRTRSPRQENRNNMTVRALLNDEGAIPVASPKGRQPNHVKYELYLRQQPVNARSCGFGDRDRRVIDPPPIVQLRVNAPGLSEEELTQRVHSPHNIVHCSIWSESGHEEMSGMPEDYMRQKRLMGNLVASPFIGLDEKGEMGCFFCFPDISCRTPGRYRLKFSLVVINPLPTPRAPIKAEVLSDVFQTFSAKEFPGMSESTALAKSLKHQGCNIPTKKGNEKTGKRDESDDYSDQEESLRRKRTRNNSQ